MLGIRKISTIPTPTHCDFGHILRTLWQAKHVSKLNVACIAHLANCSISFHSSFLEPGLWPLLVSGTNYKSDSITTTIQRQSAVFHSIHQLAQSKCIDVAVLENADKLSKDQKVDSILRASRDLLVQKVSDKTNLSPVLLSLVFLQNSNLSDVPKELIHDKVCCELFTSPILIIFEDVPGS